MSRPPLSLGSAGRSWRWSGLLLVFTCYCAAAVSAEAVSGQAAGTVASKAADIRPDVPARKPEWATPIDPAGNLYRMAPMLFRSAQIATADVQRLRELGIKTVVSLRNFHADDTLLSGSGISSVRVGINTWSINDQNVIAALKAIRQAERQGPVLLHCQHGADRTGVVAAMYRILYQGWTREQALDELVNGGYGYHAIWRNIPRYLRSVDVDKIRRGVDMTPRPSGT